MGIQLHRNTIQVLNQSLTPVEFIKHKQPKIEPPDTTVYLSKKEMVKDLIKPSSKIQNVGPHSLDNSDHDSNSISLKNGGLFLEEISKHILELSSQQVTHQNNVIYEHALEKLIHLLQEAFNTFEELVTQKNQDAALLQETNFKELLVEMLTEMEEIGINVDIFPKRLEQDTAKRIDKTLRFLIEIDFSHQTKKNNIENYGGLKEILIEVGRILKELYELLGFSGKNEDKPIHILSSVSKRNDAQPGA
jgi:hypothetical protein